MSGVTNPVSLADGTDDWDFNPQPKSAPRSFGPPTGAIWQPADADPANDPDAVPAPATPRVAPRATKASPTEDDYKNWVTIQDACEWDGFKERDADVATSLMSKLKMQPDDSLEEFATTDPEDYVNDLQSWTVDGTLASSGEKNKARRLMHVARRGYFKEG